jgi:hypothetical protein
MTRTPRRERVHGEHLRARAGASAARSPEAWRERVDDEHLRARARQSVRPDRRERARSRFLAGALLLEDDAEIAGVVRVAADAGRRSEET